MSEIEVAGLRIAYERAGRGPSVLLVHGFVGDGQSTWRSQIDTLSHDFTVVAWDAPGSGRSSDPPEHFRMADYADCLASFVSALGLGRCHLVGLSFGGAVALEVVRRHPALPQSLVLAGAYAGWTGSFGPQVAEDRLQHSLRLAELAPEEFAATMLPTMFSTSMASERAAEFARSVAELHPAGFRAMARALAEADLRDVMPRIDVPTLLLWGDSDTRSPVSVAEALHAAIPGSNLVVLAEVGHVSSVEASERFSREVRDFLVGSRHGRSSA